MPKKRGNSEGTVYQRDDGRWVATVSLGDGKRKSVYAPTQREALEKLASLRDQQLAGRQFADERLTVGQWLTSWLQMQRPPATKPKTYIAYEEHVKLHLIPALGKLALAKLTPQDVRVFMKDHLSSGFSPRSVRHYRATLRAALNVAIGDELITRNAASQVKPPRVEKTPPAVYTPEQARALLAAAAGDRLEALFTMAVSSALREGEILGLQWSDINWKRRSLTVARTLQRVKRVRQGDQWKPGEAKTEVLTITPKTFRSWRTIKLPEILVRALERHSEKQRDGRLLAGSTWKDTDYVFTSSVGTPLEQRRLLHVYGRLVRKAKLPYIRFHDLRHSAVSLLIAQGVHPRAIMELLGHSTITLTMDTYGHLFESVSGETAARMDDALAPEAVVAPVSKRGPRRVK
jgi:integrase